MAEFGGSRTRRRKDVASYTTSILQLIDAKGIDHNALLWELYFYPSNGKSQLTRSGAVGPARACWALCATGSITLPI